ncbi:hypothetical protein CspeluHIS016_0101650 [Cutaneotrichosporon spelunceum]|uniref:Transglutaminase-like domain-containing protein n=1 Tax=Cutaneotrichosporon spelunceum TaxID=1672016 RepID=A0AAD3TN67_9TREE|nr:hypothetical protein CspeluHIS016_0101650 [Cutaneotrichosporon spelunceum]
MTDDEPVFTSLKDRIAALNLKQVSTPAPIKAPPPKPKKSVPIPARDPSPVSTVPSTSSHAPTPPRPPLPAKPPLPSKVTKPPHPLPAHHLPAQNADKSTPSPQLPERSARPPLPLRKASTDPALLPGAPLVEANRAARPPPTPARRPSTHCNGNQSPQSAVRPTPSPPGQRPELPPRLPSRLGDAKDEDHAASTSSQMVTAKPAPGLPRRTLPPNVTRNPSPTPGPTSLPSSDPPSIPIQSRPPPVPLASKPKPKLAAVAASPSMEGPIPMPPVHCLVCRDYTHPDAVAARYPRQSLPSAPIPYLADVLCSPFEHLTDKARAIFTWCHHNIEYDVANFLANTIPRGHTADDTIRLGKGVCEGFSDVFEAIALAAGMRCMRVSGHGKGFGYKSPGAGVTPPYSSNHAWNAIVLDDKRWKLVDACWGAGNIKNGVWEQKFKPHEFTKSNDAFGLSHYPENPGEQFREDGRKMSWEEYIIDKGGQLATIYENAYAEGLDPIGLEPAMLHLEPRELQQAGLVRFQIPWVCDHWEANVVTPKGGPQLVMVHTNGDYIPMEYNGEWWYVDIPTDKIRGDTMIVGLDTVNGVSARGMTKDEYLRTKGRTSFSVVGYVQYEVV